jgi:hypothetical protein
MSTRVNSEMRGLGTARVLSSRSGSRVYRSSVNKFGATYLLIDILACHSQTLTDTSEFHPDICGALLVEDGQRPAPAGELARDCRGGDHGAFLALIEAPPHRACRRRLAAWPRARAAGEAASQRRHGSWPGQLATLDSGLAHLHNDIAVLIPTVT